MKWIIEPVPHGAVNQDLLPQQCHKTRKAPCEAALELQILDKQHRDQDGVDLRQDRVGSDADESLDPLGLLERFEKEFDLPSLLVNSRDGSGGQFPVIRQERELTVCLGCGEKYFSLLRSLTIPVFRRRESTPSG